MNRRGHPETLVAKQPGNKNALKAGVFSEAALAPRILEIDAAIAERSVDEVVIDVRRRGLAAILALREAMDADLEQNGLIGRRGEPRRMIDLRLRADAKVSQALERYEATMQAAVKATSDSHVERPPTLPLAEALAEIAGADRELTPESFDPEFFLYTIIVTDDPMTTAVDRRRARRMLTKRRKAQSPTCTCISTLQARDAAEFREWVDEHRGLGSEPSSVDRALAARVRAVVRGDAARVGPYFAVERTVAAVEAVIATATNPGSRRSSISRELAADEKPSWDTMTSRSRRMRTKERLDAFMELDELGVLVRCECQAPRGAELVELQADSFTAYVIRTVAEMHYRAARVVAEYPETFLAVRDAIDDALLEPANVAQDDTAAA